MDFVNTFSGAITTDIIIIFSVFFLLFFFSVVYGKSNSASLLISLYIGILIFLMFPYLEDTTLLKSSESQVTISHVSLFLIIVSLTYSIVRRMIFLEYSRNKIMKYIESGILSASSSVLFFSFLYHTIPIATLYNFGPSIDNLFSSQYFFFWLVAPLIGLFIISKR